MFTINALRPVVLLFGVLVLALSTRFIAKTQNILDTSAIDVYIENHMAEHQIPGLALSIVHKVFSQLHGAQD